MLMSVLIDHPSHTSALTCMLEKTHLSNDIYLVASGDLRISANFACWPAQEEMERKIGEAFKALGFSIIRAHDYDPKEKHGFISTQRMGMQVFQKIPKDARVIVACAVWQYSYHVLAGLRDHKGPILTIANWSGEHPGLVGLLNLNASLTKMDVEYSSLWSEDFTDAFFVKGIEGWVHSGHIKKDWSHVHSFKTSDCKKEDRAIGAKLAEDIKHEHVILGFFDEGCMGMYNALFDDEMLNKIGFYKERMSQSALLHQMSLVTPEEAESVFQWMVTRGLTFKFGSNPTSELTKDQVIEQCRMYIAAIRMADFYGCNAIGIQYQQGLKDSCAASDLAEGLMNNVDRPPVWKHNQPQSETPLFADNAVPHFNEVDTGVAVDCVVTNRVWRELGLDPATTLHDIRWGDPWVDPATGEESFVWVFEISGSAPASHFPGGYNGACSERQVPMYFPLGGGTLKGNSKPGVVVWSRIFVMDHQLHCDMGLCDVVALPEEETERRLKATTYQWPIMSAVLRGITRDQMMSRHKANHIQVAYGADEETAKRALHSKACVFHDLGIKVHWCGHI